MPFDIGDGDDWGGWSGCPWCKGPGYLIIPVPISPSAVGANYAVAMHKGPCPVCNPGHDCDTCAGSGFYSHFDYIQCVRSVRLIRATTYFCTCGL